MAKSKFIELLDSFISVYIPVSRGLSNNTVKSYKTTFTLFIIFLYEKKELPADKITFEKLDADTVSGFLQWLETERKCSVSTRNQRRAAILSFARYAQNRDFSAAATFRESLQILPAKKGSVKERTIMSHEEVKILMNLPNPATPLGYRDRVLLSVMYASGARAQEMCDLTVEDVLHNDAGDVILNLLGKGRKRRRVKLSSVPSRMLDAYIKKRGIETRPACYVFSSQCHPNMSVSGIEEVFKKYIALAKKENQTLFRGESYTPHVMRHTTACHMLESGVSLNVIKNILGHEHLATTEIYARLSQSTIDEHLKEWNKKWLYSGNESSSDLPCDSRKYIIPAFLR